MELEDLYPEDAAESAWARQEVEPDRLAYGLSLARSETSAVDDEMDRLRAALIDIRDHGLRADLTPTMDCASVEVLYVGFARYLARLDQQVRSRARAALER